MEGIDPLEIELSHRYLRYQYYGYECTDYDKMDRIIREELKKGQDNDQRFDRTMMKIKRRVITECR